MMKINLYEIDKNYRVLLIVYLIVVFIGISIGQFYLLSKEQQTPNGIVENYRGSQTVDELEIPKYYPKPLSEMLLITHTHILGFSTIILSVSILFGLTNIKSSYKSFLMIEPLVSLVVTFGSIWFVRFFHQGFVYLTIISAFLMYASLYFMIIYLVKELLFSGQFE